MLTIKNLSRVKVKILDLLEDLFFLELAMVLLDLHSFHIAKIADVAVGVDVVVETVAVVVVAVVDGVDFVAVGGIAVVVVVELVVLRPWLCFVGVVGVAGIEDVGEFEEEEGLDDAEDRFHGCLEYSEIFGIGVNVVVVDDVDGVVAVGSAVVVGDDDHDNGD